MFQLELSLKEARVTFENEESETIRLILRHLGEVSVRPIDVPRRVHRISRNVTHGIRPILKFTYDYDLFPGLYRIDFEADTSESREGARIFDEGYRIEVRESMILVAKQPPDLPWWWVGEEMVRQPLPFAITPPTPARTEWQHLIDDPLDDT